MIQYYLIKIEISIFGISIITIKIIIMKKISINNDEIRRENKNF